MHVLDDESQLTGENLTKWLDDVNAERVVIEYNGMWMLDLLYNAMPENWIVYQERRHRQDGAAQDRARRVPPFGHRL